MMALAPHTGRGAAHDIVYACCRKALEDATPLIDQLRRAPEVTRHFDDAALARLVDPANYLGTAQAMVDRMTGGTG
jgi:3-carboxy-cis,cis-muconate cycloisomerase